MLTKSQSIALDALTNDLRTCFRYDPPRGYREGKRRVSHMVERFYACSNDSARDIVDRLENRGYIYATTDTDRARWRFEPHPLTAP